MRNFIEPLAKKIKEGYYGNYECMINDLLISICNNRVTDRYELRITDKKSLERAVIKLYEEEYDFLLEAVRVCQDRTKEYLLEQINKL